MKRIALYLFFLSFAAPAFAQTKHTLTQAQVSYQVKNMGFNTSGTIKGVEAAILFDKDHLSTSSIEASADVRTINSDNDMRDGHLRKEEYFDAENYPKITMKSVSFKQKSGSNYTGEFDVTIKGKTKRVELPFTYVVNGSTANFRGSFQINRLDFGIGGNSMVLAREVTVTLNVETAM